MDTDPRYEKRRERSRLEQLRCREWLRSYMQPGSVKTVSKIELTRMAVRELGISHASFNAVWSALVEETGCHDWRRRGWQKNAAKAFSSEACHRT